MALARFRFRTPCDTTFSQKKKISGSSAGKPLGYHLFVRRGFWRVLAKSWFGTPCDTTFWQKKVSQGVRKAGPPRIPLSGRKWYPRGFRKRNLGHKIDVWSLDSSGGFPSLNPLGYTFLAENAIQGGPAGWTPQDS